MKESEFIEQNKEKWLDFENNLLKKELDPSKTAKLFVQITDDLSYARTFYKNRSVKLYLNGIAKLLFNDLNKSQKKGMAAFANFWKKDLPLTMYHARRAMLISFLVFVACFLLGVVTSMQDKNFASAILSNDYVNMTNENIAKGDPMAVYKSESELQTFLPILYNNLKVDFLTFFSGIFMAIGSLVIMIFNGVMVGVFQYFFIERGLFWPSFLTIWTHGALEISAIILSGGAGLTLGKGLLFPGTHSRFQAFKLSGMNGLKIIMAVTPITFLAAFIEGFLTRHTDIPDAVRFIFILLSFAFIFLYFFFYPRRLAKQADLENITNRTTLVYKPPVEFDPSEIFSSVKIMTETFRLLFANFLFFGRLIFFPAFICAFLVAYNPLNLFHAYENTTFNSDVMFNFNENPFLGILLLFSFFGIGFLSLIFLTRKLTIAADLDSRIQSPPIFRTLFSVFLAALLFSFIIYSNVDYTFAAAQILLPFLIFVACVSRYQDLNLYESISYAAGLIGQSWSKFLFTAGTFALISLIVYSTALYGLRTLFINDALVWALTDDEATATKISFGFIALQSFLSFFLYLCLSIISTSLLFYTLKEAYTAKHLIAKIKKIAVNK